MHVRSAELVGVPLNAVPSGFAGKHLVMPPACRPQKDLIVEPDGFWLSLETIDPISAHTLAPILF